MAARVANSTNPAPPSRQHSSVHYDSRTLSTASFASHYPQSQQFAAGGRQPAAYGTYNFDDQRTISLSVPVGGILGAGPSGYPQDEGFESEEDFEEYPPAASFDSGRGTPVNTRRSAQSMLPEREPMPGYERPRARTEDVNGPVMRQWRRNGCETPGTV